MTYIWRRCENVGQEAVVRPAGRVAPEAAGVCSHIDGQNRNKVLKALRVCEEHLYKRTYSSGLKTLSVIVDHNAIDAADET